MEKQTLAIIGASPGQRVLFEKSKELGLRTIDFAWEKGAYCKELADVYYPISIYETDEILKICKQEKVVGIVSTCSDITAEVVSLLTTKMGLHGTPYDSFLRLKDKHSVRELLREVEELSQIWNFIYTGQKPLSYPCVVKPITGASKQGVSFVHDESQYYDAIRYAQNSSNGNIMVEQYIDGIEISVESISYEGKHYVVQITDKDCTGAPHFVEIGHHQPSLLPTSIIEKIKRIVPRILDKINLQNGASHTEMKISEKGEVYLIEVNPRSGGDEISNTLVGLSTDFDYVKEIIQVSIGAFKEKEIHNVSFAGIYYLCAQTKNYVDFFKNADGKPWLVKKEILSYNLSEGTTNYDRNGFLIYNNKEKVLINN